MSGADGMETVIASLLPVDFEAHESQTIKDAALRDRAALARRVAQALRDAGYGDVAAAKAEALRDAADRFERVASVQGAFFKGYVLDMLRDRADRIEADR